MAEPTPYQRVAYEYARDRIGRPTRNLAHNNDSNSISLPVAEVVGSPEAGLTSYYTIGLGEYDAHRISGTGRPQRFEFIMVAQEGAEHAVSGLSNCALNLATGDYTASPGAIYPNVFADYDPAITTLHGLLWFPLSWEASFDGAQVTCLDVEWLQVISRHDCRIRLGSSQRTRIQGCGR